MEEAEKVLDEWVANKNLKKHAWAVEAAMRGYAVKLGADPKSGRRRWPAARFRLRKISGFEGHPFKGADWLRSQAYPEELIEGVLAHAEHTGTTRDTEMKKVIYAVDELTGLVIAVALTRPSKKLADVTVEAVMKKWKEKSFAGGVDRQMIERGAAELGVPLQEHIYTVLTAMQGISDKLGL